MTRHIASERTGVYQIASPPNAAASVSSTAPFGIPDQTLTGGLTLRSQLSHFMPCSTPSFTAGRLVPHRSLENKDFFDRRFDNPCNIDRQFK